MSDPDGIEFAAGAIERPRLLCDVGFALVFIRESRAGFSTLRRLRGCMTGWAVLAAEGLRLEAIYFCPHGASLMTIDEMRGYGQRRGAAQKSPFPPAGF